MELTQGFCEAAHQAPNPDYLTHAGSDDPVYYCLCCMVCAARHVLLESCLDHIGPISTLQRQEGGYGDRRLLPQDEGYADTMASLGHPLTVEEILGYMLAGLGRV
jgi:hypothetical protein